MKNREVVTKDNYKQIVLRRAIILCWVLLAICFIVKIFGGNFFNIVCENKNFIKVCQFIDNSVLFYIINYLSYIITTSLIILSCCKKYKFNKKEILIIAICYNLCFGLKFISLTISAIIEQLVLFIILPLIFSKSIKRTILTFILVNGFQLISLFTKNIGIGIMEVPFLIGIIFMFDYYIMLILYYLYSNLKKEAK